MMKKILGLAVAISLLMVSCDKQLDITPKGKTTLSNVADLELLLNQYFTISQAPGYDIEIITNEIIHMTKSVAEVKSQVNTLDHAYLFYNEDVDRVMLTSTDPKYSDPYRYINYMNVLLEKIDDANGNSADKVRLKAEAKILRGYFHFILVNLFAKQYDSSTASTNGGIPYVDNTDVTEEKTKLSLKEVYDKILDDCSDDIVSDLLDVHENTSRIDKAFGYAVKARVLFQMKRYDEALIYAQKALQYNNNIEDRSYILNTMAWELTSESPNQYLFIDYGMMMNPLLLNVSRETFNCFEPGDYVKDFTMMGWNTAMGERSTGLSGTACCVAFGVSQNCYGIRTEQMYYILAECLIRTGQIRKGLENVDVVREKRVYNYVTFTSQFDKNENMTEAEAMSLLQKAKLIEFIGSYDTFFDYKRWNTEADYRRTITRDLGEYGTYSLSPDSPIWVFPFPADATRHNLSLTQNF